MRRAQQHSYSCDVRVLLQRARRRGFPRPFRRTPLVDIRLRNIAVKRVSFSVCVAGRYLLAKRRRDALPFRCTPLVAFGLCEKRVGAAGAACMQRLRFSRFSSRSAPQAQQVLMEMGRWWIGRRFGVESLQGCSSKTGGYSPFFGEKSDADVKIRLFREFRTYFLLAVQRNYLMRGVLFVVIPTF